MWPAPTPRKKTIATETDTEKRFNIMYTINIFTIITCTHMRNKIYRSIYYAYTYNPIPLINRIAIPTNFKKSGVDPTQGSVPQSFEV